MLERLGQPGRCRRGRAGRDARHSPPGRGRGTRPSGPYRAPRRRPGGSAGCLPWPGAGRGSEGTRSATRGAGRVAGQGPAVVAQARRNGVNTWYGVRRRCGAPRPDGVRRSRGEQVLPAAARAVRTRASRRRPYGLGSRGHVDRPGTDLRGDLRDKPRPGHPSTTRARRHTRPGGPARRRHTGTGAPDPRSPTGPGRGRREAAPRRRPAPLTAPGGPSAQVRRCQSTVVVIG